MDLLSKEGSVGRVLGSHRLLWSHILCLLIVCWAAWPTIKQPRLEADDYRYLHHIQQWQQGSLSAVDAMTVENRWDHLWFMQEEGRIRFFRPTVVLSYAADHFLWGENYPTGLTLTNALIHLLCSCLVGMLLYRMVGSGLSFLLPTLLFAGLAAHSECIWYIAGRTDSLAALGFLAALVLHQRGLKWWALVFFVFGFLTKEMVVVAPVLVLFMDRFITRRKMDWVLYGSYAALALAVLILKRIALGGSGSDFVEPYLISPFDPGFISHLGLQFRSYCGNVLATEVTVPFADSETIQQVHRPWVPIIAVVVFLMGAWWQRREWRFWFFVSLGFLTWLPTSIVYLSERYVYLPSIAFVGIVALWYSASSKRWQALFGGALALYVFFQTAALRERHAVLAEQPGSVKEMLTQMKCLEHEINVGDDLLLVNMPGQFVRAQFAQDIFRVVFEDPTLRVDVLTMMPGQNGTLWEKGDALPVMGAGVLVNWNDAKTLQLRGRVLQEGIPPHPIQEHGIIAFNWTPLTTDTKSSVASFQTTVVEGRATRATALDFNFKPMLQSPKIVLWQADCSDLNAHPWERRKNARIQLIRP